MSSKDKQPKASAKLSAFTGGNMHVFYDCSRQWKIQLGPGISLSPAALTAGTQGQILLVSGPGVKADADSSQHILTLTQNEGSPKDWKIAVAPAVEICRTPDPAVLLATGPDKTNVVGLISSNKPLIGILVSPAPPEPETVTGSVGSPIQSCPKVE